MEWAPEVGNGGGVGQFEVRLHSCVNLKDCLLRRTHRKTLPSGGFNPKLQNSETIMIPITRLIAVAILIMVNCALSDEIPPLRFEKSKAEVDVTLSTALHDADAIIRAVKTTTDSALSFKTVFVRIDDAQNIIYKAIDRLSFMKESHPVPEVQKAARVAYEKLDAWSVTTFGDPALYGRIAAYLGSSDPAIVQERAGLNPLDRRLTVFTERICRRNGARLDDVSRKAFAASMSQLTEDRAQYGTNFRQPNTIAFTTEELAGVPSLLLGRLLHVGDLYFAESTLPEAGYVYKNSPSETTRQKAMTGRYVRAVGQNIELTAGIFRRRQELAQMLGFGTWADYQAEINMLKTPAHVLELLEKLHAGLEPAFRADIDSLRTIKVRETGNASARIEAWEVDYFQTKYLAETYHVDASILREFFESKSTMQGMFKVAEQVFGIKITPVEGLEVWSPDVTAVKISDTATGRALGLLYLDLYPRPLKKDSFSEWQLVPARISLDGTTQSAVAVLLGNFPTSDASTPSLLEYLDVMTMFHEFGHCLHEILGYSPYCIFSGTGVEPDFVEGPSVMMEQFVTDLRVLRLVSRHYQDPTRPFPEEPMQRLLASRAYSARLYDKRQIAMARMDMDVHLSKEVRAGKLNITQLGDRAMERIFLRNPPATSFINTLTHIWSGDYAAGYYRYVWANVLAADLAGAFRNAPQGFLDPDVGARYRREIYEQGGMRDASESVEKFLGRPLDEKVYLKSLGAN